MHSDGKKRKLHQFKVKRNTISSIIFDYVELFSILFVRIVSLKCILTIIRIQGLDTPPGIDSKTKANIAETVTSILPGLVSMYFHIVSSSAILHRDLYKVSSLFYCKLL